MFTKVETVVVNGDLEQILHLVLQGNWPRLVIKQEVVVEGDLALFRIRNEPISTRSLQVILDHVVFFNVD